MTRTSALDLADADCPDSGPPSRCTVALLEGHPVTFWTCPQTDVDIRTAIDGRPRERTELALALAPDRLVVVGRATGEHAVPYLDPAYRATTVVPNTQQSVLLGDDRTDNWVSRAHFTLRGGAGGSVVFTNGVPQAGGGIRPPTNGTWLVSPARRFLDAGEEIRLVCGEAVVIWLPNGCSLQLQAR
jgi:hypothetical protein